MLNSDFDSQMAQTMVTQMTFSNYPSIRIDGALAINTFLLNSSNLPEIKDSGSLGILIQSLRESFRSKPIRSNNHIDNLVQSIRALIENDLHFQQRLLLNPFGVEVILFACKITTNQIQSFSFDILDRISKVPEGPKILLQNLVLPTLLSSDFLSRSKDSVRLGACRLINRLSAVSPDLFPAQIFDQTLTKNFELNRFLHGQMEIQLLHGFLAHLHHLNDRGQSLGFLFSSAQHLVQEILCETFESIDHLQQIIKILLVLSRDPLQADHLLSHSLGAALHLLVRTDFSLYRRKTDVVTNKSSLQSQSARKSLSRTRQGPDQDRPTGTKNALSMIRSSMKLSQNDDTNYLVARSVVSIYENVLVQDPDIIVDILSSGLIPSLVFRVGTGNDKDIRFSKIVVHFLFQILTKVLKSQSEAHLALVSLQPAAPAYLRMGQSHLSADPQPQSSFAQSLRSKLKPTDLRGISHTLHSQGVTSLLFSSIQSFEDQTFVNESMACLSILSFDVVSHFVFDSENISRLFHLCQTRAECFFPSLKIICEMLTFPEISAASLTLMFEHMKVVHLLVRALHISGWIFQLKGVVYNSFGPLCQIQGFREKLMAANGMGVLVGEISSRLTAARISRRNRGILGGSSLDADDEVTSKLARVLEGDISAVKIQSLIRKVLIKRRRNYR